MADNTVDDAAKKEQVCVIDQHFPAPTQECQWYMYASSKVVRDTRLVLDPTGVESAEKLMGIDESYWLAHKWLAILISGLGPYQSMTDKIQDGYKIKVPET
eukprot:4035024-Amphidinium_carterae.1